eukprot:490142-Hanusia_phi.AAC.1
MFLSALLGRWRAGRLRGHSTSKRKKGVRERKGNERKERAEDQGESAQVGGTARINEGAEERM